MTVAIICVALLGLLLFGLGMLVSAARGPARAGAYPTDPADTLFKRMRAHGNTAEYAPMMAILMLLIGERYPATWALWVMGLAVASRYLFAAGVLLSSTLEKSNPLRFAGAVGTYLTGFLLCIAAFMCL